MCTPKSERSMMVCDIAIGCVKQDLAAALRGDVRYTVVDGQGTLVEADVSIDAAQFQSVIQEAIAAAQATS